MGFAWQNQDEFVVCKFKDNEDILGVAELWYRYKGQNECLYCIQARHAELDTNFDELFTMQFQALRAEFDDIIRQDDKKVKFFLDINKLYDTYRSNARRRLTANSNPNSLNAEVIRVNDLDKFGRRRLMESSLGPHSLMERRRRLAELRRLSSPVKPLA